MIDSSIDLTYSIVPDGRRQPVDELGDTRNKLNLFLLSHSLAHKIRQKTVANFINILRPAFKLIFLQQRILTKTYVWKSSAYYLFDFLVKSNYY